jgi:hypothetical protein
MFSSGRGLCKIEGTERPVQGERIVNVGGFQLNVPYNKDNLGAYVPELQPPTNLLFIPRRYTSMENHSRVISMGKNS